MKNALSTAALLSGFAVFGTAFRRFFAAIGLILLLAGSAQAQNFSFIASDNSGPTYSYGLLQATTTNGNVVATSGDLVVIGGPIVGTYSLIANPSPPSCSSSPTGFGYFLYSDVLYPNQNPLLDDCGLLFGGNNEEINIYSLGGNLPYAYYSFNQISGNFDVASNNANFILASTPAQRIQVLSMIVTELVNIGAQLPAEGQPLQASLSAALVSVRRGNTNSATGQLQSFIQKVQASTAAGSLTTVEGKSLIEQAQAAIASLAG
jgi:hypothetical protein